MSKTREKKVLPPSNISREQCESSFAEFAASDAKQQQITAKMDGEITKIREKYQDDLSKHTETKEKAFDVLQAYATQNPEFFTKKKSIELTHGVLGFRTGTPKLKTLKGFTWPSVTNMLKTFLPAYVRTVEEPAKDKLLADRENPEVLKLFTQVGISVDQEESFYVEPKKELAESN